MWRLLEIFTRAPRLILLTLSFSKIDTLAFGPLTHTLQQPLAHSEPLESTQKIALSLSLSHTHTSARMHTQTDAHTHIVAHTHSFIHIHTHSRMHIILSKQTDYLRTVVKHLISVT